MTKIVIIVLVLIVVLFVGLVVWGSNNQNKSFNSDKPPAVMDWFGQLGSGPKVDVKQLQPPVKTFDLSRQAKYSVVVLADDDHPFRQGKIKVQPAVSPSSSCAHVVFAPKPVSGLSKELKDPQDSSNPKIRDRNDFTLTIPKGGGDLVIERLSPLSTAPCTVALE